MVNDKINRFLIGNKLPNDRTDAVENAHFTALRRNNDSIFVYLPPN